MCCGERRQLGRRTPSVDAVSLTDAWRGAFTDVQLSDAGCEWLHVDLVDDLGPFYLDACGFVTT